MGDELTPQECEAAGKALDLLIDAQDKAFDAYTILSDHNLPYDGARSAERSCVAAKEWVVRMLKDSGHLTPDQQAAARS